MSELLGFFKWLRMSIMCDPPPPYLQSQPPLSIPTTSLNRHIGYREIRLLSPQYRATLTASFGSFARRLDVWRKQKTAAVPASSSTRAWSFHACFGSFPVTRTYLFFFFLRCVFRLKTGRSRLFKIFTLFRGGLTMSNVRLSSGSPTLERTEPRVSEHPKPSACRSLFGSVDHEELKRDLNAHLRELGEAASAKWGFDFATDTPLANSRLEWEVVNPRDLPSFYTRPPHRERGVCPGNNNVDLNGNHNCVVRFPSQDASRSDAQMECTEQCSGQRKRPACHDPSAPSKKSHTSPEEISCPSLSQSAEHTPRKTSPNKQT